MVGYLKREKLNGLLGDSVGGISIVDDIGHRLMAHHRDWVRLEVVEQLPGFHNDSVCQFLVVGIA